MKTLFSVLAIALSAVAVQAQERAKDKPAANESKKASSAAKEAPKAKKAEEVRMKEFDHNFRAQEHKTRNSIYTLGGKLTPQGKKQGEGC